MRKIILLILLICGLSALFGNAAANEADFTALVEQLKAEGVVPQSEGETISFSDFKDNYNHANNAQWFTFAEADHFVLSTKVSWRSAVNTPDADYSGCGIIFGAEPGTTNHLMASVRMDGYAYLTGLHYGSPLFYGYYYHNFPNTQGAAKFVFVLNGNEGIMYLYGKQIASWDNLTLSGNSIGFAVLSGTDNDFGIQCEWKDIFLYKW